MGYGKLKKSSAVNKGYGGKMGKRNSYNGMVKPIMGSTSQTKEPGFMSESGPHGNISAIAGFKNIGG